ncbi:MAG: hypothetical protein M3R25_03205, partial [Bacteroidota bacterium]|nr:hypothetical protein [Bacteroidota bacterium]
YLDSWTNVKSQLQSGEFMNKVHDNDFVAFRVNPYKVKGDHLCSITVKNVVNPPGQNDGRRRLLPKILSNREALIEGLVNSLNKNPKRTAGRIQTALKNSEVKSYTDKSYKILYDSGSSVLKYGISSEFAFDARAEKIIEVLEFIFKQTEYYEDYAELNHPSHIPVRFVMPSHAYLSSCYNRPTVYIDVPTLYSAIGYMSLLERYQLAMIGLGGIPHWGKINNMLYHNHQFIRDQFPMVQTWIDVRNALDTKGTFVNDFIISMGLL